MKAKQLNTKELRYSPRSENELEAKDKRQPKVLKLNIYTPYSRNGRSNSPESSGKLTTSTAHTKSNLKRLPVRAHSPEQLHNLKPLETPNDYKLPNPRIKTNGKDKRTEEARVLKLLSKKKQQLNEYLWEAAESGNLEQIVKLLTP